MFRFPRRVLAVAISILLCAVGARMAAASWPHDPTINVPVCAQAGDQWNPVSVSDGAGGTIVGWYDWRSGNADVYAQRYDGSGHALWTAGGVLVCGATGDQTGVRIVTDGSNGAVLAWVDGRGSALKVLAQRLNASGVPQWTADGVGMGTVVISMAQTEPAMVATGSGTVAIAFSQAGNIVAQRLYSTGGPSWGTSPLTICSATGTQQGPVIAYDPTSGNTAVSIAWGDDRNGNSDVYAQRVSTTGTIAWTANGVALCTAANDQFNLTATWERTLGTVVAWMDARGSSLDVYAQRVDATGAVQWAADGIAVCTAGLDQWYPKLVNGSSGKVFIGWVDWRAGEADVYAQLLVAAGTPQWTANGQPICTVSGNQTDAVFAYDGSGGLIAAWGDQRSVAASDIYAQRLNGSGVAQWTSGGVPVTTAFGDQTVPCVTMNGSAATTVSWMDQRGSDRDIFTQGVDAYGMLGIAPVIASVRDIPNDQGGRMSVRWNASALDSFPAYGITSYRIYTRLPASTTWTLADSVIAAGVSGYSRVLATTVDSTGAANLRTGVRIDAFASASGATWASDPDSGYSVDNLAPPATAPFTGTYASGLASLSWAANGAPDVAGYRLYRGGTPDFAPGADALVATPAGTSYADAAGAPYYYRLSAVDVHGNEGPSTFLLPAGAADVGPRSLPRSLALSAPAPNPLRGASTLRLSLPEEGRVRLAVFDQQGRRVRTLADGVVSAGEHPFAWDGRDERGNAAGNALYFVRLETGGRTLVRRLAVVR